MSGRPFIPSRPVAELLLVLGVPAAMAYMAIASAVHGTFAAPGCGLGRILVLTLFGPDKQGLTCFRLPFTADLPSLGLGVTSEMAVVLYLLVVRRLRDLDVLLADPDTGIFGRDQLTQEPMKSRYDAFVAKLRVAKPVQLVRLPAGVLAAGVWFYDGYHFPEQPPLQGAGERPGRRAPGHGAAGRVPAVVVGALGNRSRDDRPVDHRRVDRYVLRLPASVPRTTTSHGCSGTRPS